MREAIGAELGSSRTAVNHGNALSKELSLQWWKRSWEASGGGLCLRCTDPTLSAVHHARGAVAICDVRLTRLLIACLLPASGWPAGPALPHGLHASASAPPSHQSAPAAPAFANAWRSTPLHSSAPSPPPCTRRSRSYRTHACAPSGQPSGCSSRLHGGEGDCKLGNP
jgi:hypothetical protein